MSKLFNPDYLLSLCKKYSLTPSKKYGQNYLLDEQVIASMLEAGSVSSGDTVVEVGPGFGVLTIPLVEKAGTVISYEIEKKIAPYWEAKRDQYKNLTVVWGNVLHSFEPPPVPYKVIANLPYQITSAVIRLFLELDIPPTVLVCMVQKEVAERICAQAGDLSLLALSVQLYATPTITAQVPKTSFWPVPAVDSAVITLTPHQKPLIAKKDSDFFFTLVKAGFAQRRKLLIKNLLPVVGKKHKGEVQDIFVELGIPLEARAQEVSMEDWILLAKRLSTYTKL